MQDVFTRDFFFLATKPGRLTKIAQEFETSQTTGIFSPAMSGTLRGKCGLVASQLQVRCMMCVDSDLIKRAHQKERDTSVTPEILKAFAYMLEVFFPRVPDRRVVTHGVDEI